jgi:hypothetical protein
VAELAGGRIISYKDTKLILRYGNYLNSGGDFVEE